jgi:hypothetical protein
MTIKTFKSKLISTSKIVGRMLLVTAFILGTSDEIFLRSNEIINESGIIRPHHLLILGGLVEIFHRCFRDTIQVLKKQD